MSRVLGVDPGLAIGGYAFRERDGWQVGVWCTSPADGSDAERLEIVLDLFRRLLDDWPADVLALETQYLRPDLPGGVGRSVLMVSRVAGALVGVARERGMGVVEVTPQRAKLALAGKGNASKDEMLEAAERGYGLRLSKGEHHAADALGMALAGEAEWRFRRETVWTVESGEQAPRTAGAAYADKQPGAKPGVRRRVIG